MAVLTITFTDSAFVGPLTENRNISPNNTYDYFKSLAQLNTFKLPVYFLKGELSKMTSFKKTKNGFSGHGEPRTKETQYPEDIFKFSGYPTIFIFDKKGNLIYNKTSFSKDGEGQQERNIKAAILMQSSDQYCVQQRSYASVADVVTMSSSASFSHSSRCKNLASIVNNNQL